MWLPAGGKSLWPLVLGGDLLLVQRCSKEELAPGDLALLEAPRSLIAHIVATVEPLSTVSIVGLEDPPGLPVLGRVVALRRGSTRVNIPRGARRLVWLAPIAATALKHVPLLRGLVRRLRDR